MYGSKVDEYGSKVDEYATNLLGHLIDAAAYAHLTANDYFAEWIAVAGTVLVSH